MKGSLSGEDKYSQLQHPWDGLYRGSVEVGGEQQGIDLGRSKAKPVEVGKEESWEAN